MNKENCALKLVDEIILQFFVYSEIGVHKSRGARATIFFKVARKLLHVTFLALRILI